MNITWYGYSCFKIEDKLANEDVTLVLDPYVAEKGKKLPPSLSANIVTSSHDHERHNNIDAVGGDPFVIKGPGEYEVRDIMITGVSTFHDEVDGKKQGTNTIFFFTVGGVHMAHLGDLKHALEGKHLEDPHPIDVLFVPIGGKNVLNAKQAADVIGQLDPRVVIPMHYKTPKLGADLDTVDAFLKAMGVSDAEKVTKFKLTKKTLPQEDTKYVILDPQ